MSLLRVCFAGVTSCESYGESPASDPKHLNPRPRRVSKKPSIEKLTRMAKAAACFVDFDIVDLTSEVIRTV